MIALYDHIQELRAELGSCIMTRRERKTVEQELAQTIAEQNAMERALDDALATQPDERR